MILFIQPIFAPDLIRLEQNKKSIISIGNYLKKYPHDIKFIFGGWAYDNFLWESIEKVIIDNIPKNNLMFVKRFDKNFGKAYVVNSLYKLKNTDDFQYFLTCDSDIIFSDTCNNMFERLIDVAVQSQRHTKKKFGFISLNQKEGCCHAHQLLNVKYKITNRYSKVEMVSYPSDGKGIAGGCLFINKELWEKIGGYKILGVYAGEDGSFLRDTHNNNYSFQVTNDIFVIHPHATDIEYAEMKWKIVHNQNLNNIKNSNPDNLNQVINFMDEYWKNKNLK